MSTATNAKRSTRLIGAFPWIFLARVRARAGVYPPYTASMPVRELNLVAIENDDGSHRQDDVARGAMSVTA